ncbi:MAG: hypothetical protein MZW92_06145 [Comamonadaceae bacterium]|nr:hypothetical protein [Comamonadaceae bacterium]
MQMSTEERQADARRSLNVRRRTLLRAAGLLLLLRPSWAQPAFDHEHAAWDALLKKHVRLEAGGNASRVDYRSFAADRAALRSLPEGAVGGRRRPQYGGWSNRAAATPSSPTPTTPSPSRRS